MQIGSDKEEEHGPMEAYVTISYKESVGEVTNVERNMKVLLIIFTRNHVEVTCMVNVTSKQIKEGHACFCMMKNNAGNTISIFVKHRRKQRTKVKKIGKGRTNPQLLLGMGTPCHQPLERHHHATLNHSSPQPLRLRGQEDGREG